MKNKTIESVPQFLSHVLSFEQQHIAQWFYRGVSSSEHKLVPSLFRISLEKMFTDWRDLESYLMTIFAREAYPFAKELGTIDEKNELEWLALAQHHGLPTRLLDWTTNPLMSLFFACEFYKRDTDASVYCYGFPSTNNCLPESSRMDRRKTLEKSGAIIFPTHISSRITTQNGCFTYHDLPDRKSEFIPMEEDDRIDGIIEKLIIPKDKKKLILDELFELGIHHGLVYPGLDGIAKKLKYEVTDTHKRISNPKQIEKLMKKFPEGEE